MLKQRVLTALLLAPLVLWGVLVATPMWFALALGVVFAMGAWEWSRLSGLVRWPGRLLYVLLAIAGMWLLYQGLSITNFALMVLVVAMMWWVMALMAVLSYPQGNLLWQQSALARGCAGMLVLLPAWLALVVLHSEESLGAIWVILLMLLIWAADTGAYFAGRRFGRHKLAPSVSPGKSWEGVAGGVVLALVVAVLATWWLSLAAHWVAYLGLVMLTILISVLGDLSESLFKRIAGIKDSGGLLPGHGGILDRIDSLTAAAPLFVLGLLWLG